MIPLVTCLVESLRKEVLKQGGGILLGYLDFLGSGVSCLPLRATTGGLLLYPDRKPPEATLKIPGTLKKAPDPL